MNAQLDIFGRIQPVPVDTGETRKESGIKKVSGNNAEWLCWIRSEAVKIALCRGQVSAEDLNIIARRENRQPTHVNAWGAVFRGKEWVIVGRKRSATKSAHARTINIYEFRGTE